MFKKLTLTVSVLMSFLFASTTYAVCPICTIAVGAGIGLAQWLGIDDAITGLWIGGLTVSLIIWTINWLRKKNIKVNAWLQLVIIIGYYVLIFAPLYFHKIIGHTLNKLWGIDKLILGSVIGSIFFWLGSIWYENLKKKNDGHAYFPFQKVIMPVGFLLIWSVFFYFLTK